MEYINIGNETEQLEFKKSTGELKEGIISIVSILNKHGSGELYFGVKNNGDVIGQDVNDTTLRNVSRAIGNHIKPKIYPEITEKEYADGRKTVYVRFEGNRQPYQAYNVARIRISDEDTVMEPEQYVEMYLEREEDKFSWERKLSDYTIDDIDMTAFNSYINKAKSVGRIEFDSNDPEIVLEKLGLLDGNHLLNAGAALFCNCETNDVQMAKFATDVRATFTDIRRYDKGSIIGLADVCEQYIKDAIDWKADIVGFDRIETPEIPVEAIREAIINSYGHRRYANNQCNEIVVFKNRIEIHTTGGFPKGHTPEEFLDGNKKAIRRNKLITQVLYYSKDMETFATGLKRIKDECDKAGCKVEFKAETDDFIVIFYRNLRKQWTGKPVTGSELQSNEQDVYQNNKQRDNQNISKKRLEDIIIEEIRKNEKVTREYIAQIAGVSEKTVERRIQEMPNVEYVGVGSWGHWIIHESDET